MKFSQCYTDVPKVTVHYQYAKVKNQMLQCYSVTAHPRAKSQRNMLIIISNFVGLKKCITRYTGGWSGGAMVLGKLPVPGRPTFWITVGQGPTALVVGAGGGCLDVFILIYPFLFFLPLFGRRPDID